MQRVEQRLEILPEEQSKSEAEQEKKEESVKVLSIICNSEQRARLLEFAEQLAQPELCWGERLSIAAQLLMMFGMLQDRPPPMKPFVSYVNVSVYTGQPTR